MISLYDKMTKGTYEDRFKAWGEYLRMKGRNNLRVKDHEGLYYLGKEARKNGVRDAQIDGWIKEGRG